VKEPKSIWYLDSFRMKIAKRKNSRVYSTVQ